MFVKNVKGILCMSVMLFVVTACTKEEASCECENYEQRTATHNPNGPFPERAYQETDWVAGNAYPLGWDDCSPTYEFRKNTGFVETRHYYRCND